MGADGNLYIADPEQNRILACASDGQMISQIDAAAGGAKRQISGEIATWNKYVFVMDMDGHTVHAWSTDGKPELDADFAPELGPTSRFPPSLATSPRGELLVLDDHSSRVLRYQIKF